MMDFEQDLNEIEWAVANVSQILMSVMGKIKLVDNDTDSS